VTCAFVREALARGCAGIFLALQDATRGVFDEQAYHAFGTPGDQRVLEAARQAGGWFNVLHMHGTDVHFGLLKDYDVTALNWHVGETPPSMRDYRAGGGARPIVGGLQRTHITGRDQDAITRDIERAMQETGGRGLLLAPPCVIRHPVDMETLGRTAATIRALAQRPN
jgi:uroporphyrinogen decarboxylase